MRVALIIEWLDSWRGGAETSTGQFLRHLLGLGVDVDVFTRSRAPSRPGMNVHTIRVSAPSRTLQTLAFCRAARVAARSGGADLVHAITPSLRADVYQPRGGTCAETIKRNLALRTGGPARALKGIALRANVRQRMLLGFERRILTGPDLPVVIALSDYVVAQLRDHYDFPAARIRKVFNGVDVNDADEDTRARNRRQVRGLYEIGDDDVFVLMVAHNFKLKGLRTWIDALAMLVREGHLPGLRSVIVGKGRVLPWQNLVARRGLSGVVQFAGATQRVQAFYHAADVLVHPTFYDPCSRVVLEAMSSGLPCITTRYDGAAEAVREAEGGLILESPRDVAGLAAGVRRVADAGVRVKLGAAARRAAGVWSMRRHAEGVVDVYRTVCDGLIG